MSSTIIPISRAQLNDLPGKRRRDAIANAVNQVFTQVTTAATDGKTSCIVNINDVTRDHGCCWGMYIPNASDMVDGLQAKFPDCNVKYTGMWEDTQPGMHQLKRGVLVDWS